MASGTRIRGITIKLAADYNEVIKAFRSIKSQATQSQRTLSDIQKLLNTNPKSKLLQDQQFKYTNKLIKETEDKLRMLKNQLREGISGNKFQGDVKKQQQALDALGREIVDETTKLKNLKNALNLQATERYVQSTTQKFSELNARLEASKNLLSKLPTNAQLINSNFRNTVNTFKAATERVKALKEHLANLAKQKSTEKLEAEMHKYRIQLEEAKADVVELYGAIQRHPTGVGAAMQSIGSSVQGFGNKITSVGTSLYALSATLTLVGRSAYTMARDVETSMQKVRSIVVANGDDMKLTYDDLYEGVIEASNRTGVAITDFNEAVYQSVSASVDAGKAINFTTEAVKLARGGFTDTISAVDILTTVINAYGRSADEASVIANNLLVTQNRGKTTVDALAGSLGKTIPSASAANVSFEQLSAAMGVMTKNGINTQLAATALRSLFDELNKSSSKANKALVEMSGQGFSGLMKSGKTLTDVLGMLTDYAHKNGKAFTDMLGNVRSRTAAVSLMTANGAEYNEILKEMYENQTACNDAFKIMDDTPAVQMQKNVNKLKNTLADLGREMLPTIINLSDKLVVLAEKFNALDDSTKQSIINFATIAAVSAPLITTTGRVITAFGSLISGTGSLINVLGRAKASVVASNEAFAVMDTKLAGATTKVASFAASFAPVLPAVGVLAALGAGAAIFGKLWKTTDWYKENQEFAESFKPLNDGLKEATETLSNFQAGSEFEKVAVDVEDLIYQFSVYKNAADGSASSNARLTGVIKQLQSAYPSLEASISNTTEELERQVKKAERTEKLASINEKITEGYEAMDDALQKIKETETLINQLRSKGGVGNLMQAKELEETLEATREEYDATAESVARYEEDADRLTRVLQSTADGHKNLAAVAMWSAQSTENAAIKFSSASELYENLTDTQKQTAGAFVTAVNEMQSNLESSIEKSMQLFDEWNGGAETSFEQIVGNLRGQIDGLRTWEEDMNTIFQTVSQNTGQSLNTDLYNQILAAGPSNASAVHEIATEIQNTGGAAIDDLNALWEERASTMSLVGDGSQLLENSTEAIASTMEGVNELFQMSGEDTWTGFAEGMRASISAATEAAEEGANETLEAVNNELGIASPSKKFKESGEYCGDGLSLGLKSKVGLVTSSARSLATAADIRNMAGALQSSAQYVGSMIGQGLATGMNSRLSQIQSIASQMANTATTAIRSTAKVESPSKITTWIGEMIGDGLIVGMEEKMNAVARAAQSLVSIPTAAAAMTNSVSNMNQVNNMTFNVSGVNDPQSIANYVMRTIQSQMTQRNGVWA